jgi:hypothetical protein
LVRLVLLLLAVLAGFAQTTSNKPPSPKWKLRFFLDEDKRAFRIHDIQFASSTHGMAVGVLTEGDKERSAGALTTDGGSKWDFVRLPDGSRTVYFLDPSKAWLVAEDGIHHSTDGGRKWDRLAKLRGVVRLHFLDANKGFAAGAPKKVWQTGDGGRTWTEVAAAAEQKADPDRSIYSWIEFSPSDGGSPPKVGVIGGYHQPARADRSFVPDWMDPERARNRRQWPSLTLVMQTIDGGETWKTSSSSILGRLTRYKVAAGGLGLSLVEFQESFEWPSEVYRMDLNRQVMERTFREKDRAITDIAIGDGVAYLAGYEPVGTMTRLPVPGKVKIFRSPDLKVWSEMDVDYRAVAGRVLLSARPRAGVWAATDTGMILQLVVE